MNGKCMQRALNMFCPDWFEMCCWLHIWDMDYDAYPMPVKWMPIAMAWCRTSIYMDIIILIERCCCCCCCCFIAIAIYTYFSAIAQIAYWMGMTSYTLRYACVCSKSCVQSQKLLRLLPKYNCWCIHACMHACRWWIKWFRCSFNWSI